MGALLVTYQQEGIWILVKTRIPRYLAGALQVFRIQLRPYVVYPFMGNVTMSLIRQSEGPLKFIFSE